MRVFQGYRPRGSTSAKPARPGLFLPVIAGLTALLGGAATTLAGAPFHVEAVGGGRASAPLGTGLQTALSLSYDAAEGVTTEPELRPRARRAPAKAFERELRKEALRQRNESPWVNASEDRWDDEPVRRGRERAAERVLTDAAGAGAEAVLEGLMRGRRLRMRASETSPHRLRTGFDLDTSPAWTVRRNTGRTSLRMELPLTPLDPLRLRCTRVLSSSDRVVRKMGTSFTLDPWDQTAKVGFSCDF